MRNVIVGNRYGHVVVAGEAGRRGGLRYVLVACECGSHYRVLARLLKSAPIELAMTTGRLPYGAITNAVEGRAVWRKRRSA